MKTVAVVGNKSPELGGYGAVAMSRVADFAGTWLREAQPDRVVLGMRLGWDQSVAYACRMAGVPFVVAVPHEGVDEHWQKDWKKAYRSLLSCAEEVVLVSKGSYQITKIDKQLRWMVDRADRVVTLWQGEDAVVARCLRYAVESGRPVENVWDRWMVFTAPLRDPLQFAKEPCA